MKRSESLVPEINEALIAKSTKAAPPNSAIYLKERGLVRYLIQNGEIEEARSQLSQILPQEYSENIVIKSLLDALQFLIFIE